MQGTIHPDQAEADQHLGPPSAGRPQRRSASGSGTAVSVAARASMAQAPPDGDKRPALAGKKGISPCVRQKDKKPAARPAGGSSYQDESVTCSVADPGSVLALPNSFELRAFTGVARRKSWTCPGCRSPSCPWPAGRHTYALASSLSTRARLTLAPSFWRRSREKASVCRPARASA